MSPSAPWSKTDNTQSKDPEMHHLTQPRGKGYVFRMKTPDVLVGARNPKTGKPFGREIKHGLNTRNRMEAKKARDIMLGDIRRLAAERGGIDVFSMEAARELAPVIRRERNEGLDSGETSTADVIRDMIEVERKRPSFLRKTTEKELQRFAAVAIKGEAPLIDELPRYIEDRSPGNRFGYKLLTPATVRDVKTAVQYLEAFAGPGIALQSVTPDMARKFLQDHLPNLKSPRAPAGMSAKTVAKHASMLLGLWRWAVERGVLDEGAVNPWEMKKTVPRSKAGVAKIMPFTPEQTRALFDAYGRGDRLGILIRFSLLTGCRADELAQLRWTQVNEGRDGFTIHSGKTENAARYIPLSVVGRGLMDLRHEQTQGEERVFPEWPVRKGSGKASSLSQAFTRERRATLGADTDGSLKLHSFRHVWRTAARRAGLNEADTNELGGWAGPRASSSTYDHGLLKKQLAEAQEKVTEQLRAEGYLEGL